MSRATAHLARHFTTLADVRTDGQLLAAFLAERDGAAFAVLVQRHGPLVWGACRRLLPDPADAEDAFQATFLVLVRRAKRLAHQRTVGPWLYRVAAWTARNVRRRNARILARRVPLSPTTADPCRNVADLGIDLDAALLALPEKYRTPLILCHLQGWSRRDAADQLGCPEGTLSSLLSRGLAKLREKLWSHDPANALAVAGVAVPSLLVTATVQAASATQLAVAGAISSSVSQLVEGVMQTFWVKRATAATVALVVVFGMGAGIGVSVRDAPAVSAAADDKPASQTPTPSPAAGEDDDPKLRQLRSELAETEAALKTAKEMLPAAKEKLRLVKEAVKDGKATRADADRAEIALAELDLNLAVLEMRLRIGRSEIDHRIYDIRNPPPKPLQPQPTYIEVTVTLKNKEWDYTAREFGPFGNSPGTATFSNFSVLAQYLVHASRDPKGPKEVRIIGGPGVSMYALKMVRATGCSGFERVELRPANTDAPSPEPVKPQP